MNQATQLISQGNYEAAAILLKRAIERRQDSPGNILQFRLAQMVANQYTRVINDEHAFQLLEELRQHPQTGAGLRDYCTYYQLKMFYEGRALQRMTVPLNDYNSIPRLYLIKDKIELDKTLRDQATELLNNFLKRIESYDPSNISKGG